jgi:hypothetical protein
MRTGTSEGGIKNKKATTGRLILHARELVLSKVTLGTKCETDWGEMQGKLSFVTKSSLVTMGQRWRTINSTSNQRKTICVSGAGRKGTIKQIAQTHLSTSGVKHRGIWQQNVPVP